MDWRMDEWTDWNEVCSLSNEYPQFQLKQIILEIDYASMFHYRKLVKMVDQLYQEGLEESLSFSNISNVSYLCRLLDISDEKPLSAMRGLHR